MSRAKWINALGHGIIGLALHIFLLAGTGWSAWACAIPVWALFYGREHSQEERKVADKLGVNHGVLWRAYPVSFLKCLVPWTWSPGNLWGFLIPVIVTIPVYIFS